MHSVAGLAGPAGLPPVLGSGAASRELEAVADAVVVVASGGAGSSGAVDDAGVEELDADVALSAWQARLQLLFGVPAAAPSNLEAAEDVVVTSDGLVFAKPAGHSGVTSRVPGATLPPFSFVHFAQSTTLKLGASPTDGLCQQ